VANEKYPYFRTCYCGIKCCFVSINGYQGKLQIEQRRGRGFQLCAMRGDNESNKIFDQFFDLEDSVSGDDKYCFKRF